MTLRDSMMGKAGHALEVLVEGLFAYNGFETTMNKRTTHGEIDVMVKYAGYDAFIECKEFNAKSTANVTRDMISNIAKKAELGGVKNAVLVTTKPPSEQLHAYAKAAGVTLRSHLDVAKMKGDLVAIAEPAKRTTYLIDAFALVDDPAKREQRQDFLTSLFGDWRTIFSSEPKFEPEAPRRRQADEVDDLLGLGGLFQLSKAPNASSDPFGLGAALLGEPPRKRRRKTAKGRAGRKKGKSPTVKKKTKKRQKNSADDPLGLGLGFEF